MQYKTYTAKCRVHSAYNKHMVIASSEQEAQRQFLDKEACDFDISTIKELKEK